MLMYVLPVQYICGTTRQTAVSVFSTVTRLPSEDFSGILRSRTCLSAVAGITQLRSGTLGTGRVWTIFWIMELMFTVNTLQPLCFRDCIYTNKQVSHQLIDKILSGNELHNQLGRCLFFINCNIYCHLKLEIESSFIKLS